ncbi:MAG: hypothetical protein DHS20C16_19010 [Phycisphaerae bacterium]|nr:MAG: hypothetical protein DHS20C16_19010 [Phycisphaerae bacterium]
MKKLGKLYQFIALIALIHLGAILVGVGWLAKSGKLNKENMLAIAKVLGLADDAEQDETTEEGGSISAVVDASSTTKPTSAPVTNSVQEELARRSLQRAVTQAEHRRVLANRAMLDVRRRREELERLAEQQSTKVETQTKQKAKEGFKKDLEILSSLKPKIALDSLLARSVDDAAQMMLLMETRQAKKIMEAASKDDAKWAQMIAIENKLREATTLTGEDETESASTEQVSEPVARAN